METDSSSPAASSQPVLLTLEEIADALAVSRSQVYALVRTGELAALKIGGRGVWRVEPRCLEEYVQRVSAETAGWVRTHPFDPSSDGEPHA